MGVIVDNPATLVSIGNFSKPEVLIGILGLILAVTFYSYRVRVHLLYLFF